MIELILSIAALAPAIPATGQSSTPAAQAAPAPDPARLQASRALLDVLMPPATREQMIQGMMAPMLANIQRAIADNPQFAQTIGSDPEVKALFDAFMGKQLSRTTEMLRAGLPGMVEAMIRAYARRFDVAQLTELRRFFESPAGQTYMRESMTIMGDPDVAAWQRTLMSQSMNQAQADAADFARQLAAREQRSRKQ